MKKLFTAIRQHDNTTVKELLEKKPELISCVAKQPPKKDDGQSPLQVSFKCSNFEITDLLLSLGADVNFMESESINKWRAPVIHDAINAAIMCSRWNTTSFGFTVHSTKEKADKTLQQLQRMIELGADVNAVDSYGNSPIWRACLQASQILPSYNYTTETLSDERIITGELISDLSRIFDLLLEHGADINYTSPNNSTTLTEYYKKQPLYQFINQ